MNITLGIWGFLIALGLGCHNSSAEMERVNGYLRNRGWQPYQNLLETADRLTLFSLPPERPKESAESKGPGLKPREYFGGYEVLGQTALPPGTNRTRLLKIFESGINHAESTADCFVPRHGLRVWQGDETTDFVICFSCHLVIVRSGTNSESFMVTGEPAEVFDATLKRAGLRLRV